MEEELEYLRIREELHGRILKKIDFSKEVGDDGILDLIDTEITEASREHGLALGEMEKMRQELFYSIRKLDVLQELLDDPSITEIMINGSESIYIERDGAIFPYPAHFASGEKLYDVIQKVVADCDRTVNTGRPIADARLPNGSRVNIVLPPAAINGPIVTIRRFPERPIRMDDLLRLGSVPEEAAGFLRCVVAAGYNIFISGGTGSGKTTFLNALSEYIPSGERVITIEDNAELQIQGIPNLVRLEARTANVEGGNEITIRDLIRTSLRMRPDRIIVGEVRGAETIDMLQAMNTGHDGSMSTGHANSPADMLLRLETLILMGMDLPAGAIRGTAGLRP
jgi:pilus assembly protein CpaF